MTGSVVAVHRSLVHGFSKAPAAAIELVPGQGVRDDAHFGTTVQHRSRVAKDPTQPNRRQVHLLQAELLDELAIRGFIVEAGRMGVVEEGGGVRAGDTVLVSPPATHIPLQVV